MSIFTIENHFNVALISLTIAPSTALALTLLLFAYLYILHTRNNPIPIRGPAITQQQTAHNHGDNRGVGRPLRRPSFFRRISTRLRTRKRRDQPVAPLWLPFPSFWLPLRQRLGDRGLGFGRQIQSAGMASRRKR